MVPGLDFCVLGPVEVQHDGRPVPIGRRRERLLLALLLLEADREVSAELLLHDLWPEQIPEDPRRALQVCASRLRSALTSAGAEAGVLVGTRGSYRLAVEPERVDAHRFARLTELAQRTTDPGARRDLLRQALALWRGPALSGATDDEPLRARLAKDLDEARHSAVVERIGCDLALGEGVALIPELRRLTTAHPRSERLVGALMQALWQAGRSAEALEVFRDHRNAMVDDLGLDPAPDLQDLERQILTGAVYAPPGEAGAGAQGAPGPTPGPTGAPQAGRVPYELPPDVPLLVGRRDLLTEAEALLGGPPPSRRPRVLNLHGGAGIGKSALAVRIGHRVAADYPDGVLFLSLRAGIGQPMESRVALDRLLRSLSVPAGSIPPDTEGRAARWRTETAGRRILLVLDDAADVAQVRPLIPAAKGCSVVITARRPLLGLELATSRAVPPLDPDKARALLARLAGESALESADEAALGHILATCGGMPLALRIVGSRLADVGGEDLGEIAGALADSSEQLDWLVAGDLAVRASLELAYADAARSARFMFDRLAPLTGDTIGAWGAAALADVPERRAAEALQALCELGLLSIVVTPVGRRYRLLSLVRSFAQERWGQLSAETRSAAMGRLVRTATYLTNQADERLGHGVVLASGLRQPAVVSTPVTESAIDAHPREWLDTECEFLAELVSAAPDTVAETAGALALQLSGYLMLGSHREQRNAVLDAAIDGLPPAASPLLWARLRQAQFAAWAQADRPAAELAVVARSAVEHAERAGDTRLQANALLQAGYAAHRGVELVEARAAYERALEVAERVGEAQISHSIRAGLGEVLDDLGHTEEALEMLSLGVREGSTGARARAVSLDVFANVAMNAGDAVRAAAAVEQMEQILGRLGDEVGRVYLLTDQGRLAVLQGRLDEARALLGEAAAAFVAQADDDGQIRVDRALAELEAAAGDPDAAGRAIERALQRAERTGNALEHLRVVRLRDERLSVERRAPSPPG